MPNIRPGLTTGLFAAARLLTMADRSAPIPHARQPSHAGLVIVLSYIHA